MKIEIVSPDSMWSHLAVTNFLEKFGVMYKEMSKIFINVKSNRGDYVVSVRINIVSKVYNVSHSNNSIKEAAIACAIELNEKLDKETSFK